MAYLKYLDFSLPKKNNDPNLWADHWEFFCYISQEGIYSKQQLIDRILDENSNDPSKAIEDVISKEEIEEITNLYSEEDTFEDSVDDDSRNDSRIQDKLDSKASEFLAIISDRRKNFGNSYPFVVELNTVKLTKNLSIQQQLYIILLCSSLMRLATPSGINKLGHHFEDLCAPVFKKLTPAKTKNLFFGSGNSNSNYFSGTFYEKVLQLCDILHVPPSPHFNERNAGVNNSGDGGLDWVGVYDFTDKQMSQPVFFGQCACGTDWIDKEFDAHISRWKNYIHFANGYLTYHFIPRNYRNVSFEWYNPLNIFDLVLVDRYRIVEMLSQDKTLPILIKDLYTDLITEMNINKVDMFA